MPAGPAAPAPASLRGLVLEVDAGSRGLLCGGERLSSSPGSESRVFPMFYPKENGLAAEEQRRERFTKICFSSSPVAVELSTWWCSFGTSRRRSKTPNWEENSSSAPGKCSGGANCPLGTRGTDQEAQQITRVESSDVRERGGRHCWQVTAGSKRSQCSLTDKCHIHEGATRALGTSTKGSGDGETEAPPACGGRIESHQARPSSRAELLFFTQVLCP
ncbi:PREDICTED: uncharacterized protein LOC108448942 isoform X1 [Corvus brachyrhynchos]|uniref:uncharacterized protein LOC108448942 isoform X1 n=1 Tax=Corvus brachyrhynchos TaxID=85066 RepID=UPI00081649A5|nr:PREDICTED: uncharacterized protein LOC108448942 isoform X1 [Corvus brachyrhynchos]